MDGMDQIGGVVPKVRLAGMHREGPDRPEPSGWTVQPPSSCLSDDEWRSIQQTLGLSRRQLQIVLRIFDGLREESIGRQLGISSHTVHAHLNRLYGKLHVKSRSELIVCVFLTYVCQVSAGRV